MLVAALAATPAGATLNQWQYSSAGGYWYANASALVPDAETGYVEQLSPDLYIGRSVCQAAVFFYVDLAAIPTSTGSCGQLTQVQAIVYGRDESATDNVEIGFYDYISNTSGLFAEITQNTNSGHSFALTAAEIPRYVVGGSSCSGADNVTRGSSADCGTIGCGEVLCSEFPAYVAASSFRMTLVADASAAAAAALQSVQVRAYGPPPPQPDLVVQSISCTPDPQAAGGAVSCSITVVNQGTASTGAGFTTTVTNGSSTATCTMNSTGSLAAGSTRTGTCSTSVPSGANPGTTASFTATVDSTNAISNESSESNNQGSDTVSVAGLPDLIVQSLTCTPDPQVAGGAVSCSITVLNQGTASIGAGFTTTVTNGSSTATCTMNSTGSLAAGSTRSGTCSTSVPSGANPGTTASFTATVDSTNAISNESSESNNQRADTVSVAGVPDLIVQSLTCTPDPQVAGGAVSCSVTVRNQGSASTGAGFTTTVTNGSSTATCTMSSPGALAAGSTRTGTCSTSVPSGATPGNTASFTATVDSTNGIINESSESNNQLGDSVSVAAAPQSDLVVDSVSCSPDPQVAGGAVTCSITVRNQGSASTGAGFTTTVTNGSSTATCTMNSTGSLAAGSTRSGTCSTSVPNGATPGTTASFTATADSTNAITNESSEGNNQLGDTVSVTAAPQSDLVVDSVTCTPDPQVAGGAVTCSITVRNQGSASAGAGFTTTVTNGSSTATCTMNSTGSLAAGSTRSGTCSTSVPIGATPGTTASFTATADSTNAITNESSESNNQSAITVSVVNSGGLAALLILFDGCDRTSAHPTDSVSCSVSVTSSGAGTPPSPVLLRLLFDGVALSGTCPGVGAPYPDSADCVFTVPDHEPGVVPIEIQLVDLGDLPEHTTGEVDFTVLSPSEVLTVEFPANPCSGGTTFEQGSDHTCTFNLRSTVPVPAGGVTYGLYLSRNQSLETALDELLLDRSSLMLLQANNTQSSGALEFTVPGDWIVGTSRLIAFAHLVDDPSPEGAWPLDVLAVQITAPGEYPRDAGPDPGVDAGPDAPGPTPEPQPDPDGSGPSVSGELPDGEPAPYLGCQGCAQTDLAPLFAGLIALVAGAARRRGRRAL